MPLRRLRPALALAAAACAFAAAPADANEVCDPGASRGPIALMILTSGQKVHEYARATAKGSLVVAYDPTTVVFKDGRVITADVEAATGHLNRLGWASRGIRVVKTLPAPRARPRRARG
jgi:ABC-type amino acid transport substrate-binding protein